jgi:hypothetical protein
MFQRAERCLRKKKRKDGEKESERKGVKEVPFC